MTLNDYTHHVCDRFILVFIAFVGLVGTTYIIISGNLDCGNQPIQDVTTIFEARFHQPIGIKKSEEKVIAPGVTSEEIVVEEGDENYSVSD